MTAPPPWTQPFTWDVVFARSISDSVYRLSGRFMTRQV